MKMSEIVRKLREETEYQQFFKATMKKFNISSPADLKDPTKKKEFFDYIDKNYKAKVEGVSASGKYPVHPEANFDVKQAVASINNYIKNTKPAQPELLVSLILDLVEAEVRQEMEDWKGEVGLD